MLFRNNENWGEALEPTGSKKMVTRNRDGFTLVELLVVITIIGMLMALIFPAAGTIVEMMNRTSCTNNQREIANGLLMFDGRRTTARLPTAGRVPAESRWSLSSNPLSAETHTNAGCDPRGSASRRQAPT